MAFYKKKESDTLMNAKRLESRNSSMDILRIVAVFLVNSVHFFLYNGFYSETVTGIPMFIMVQMRTLFATCVPLFMVLTGYLMCKKELSGGYYKGIRKTLVVFALSTIPCMIFKVYNLNDTFDLAKLITDTLNFKGSQYSWYIEMYIGLFLIAPFLNLAYNGLKSQRQKQVLVMTFVGVAILPTLFNSFVYNPLSWWANPASSDDFFKIVPAWWGMIYPLAYYFTGAYLREYGIKARTKTVAITFVISQFVFGAFNFYRSYGTTFKTGSYINWGGIQTYLLTVMVFVLISRIKTDNWCVGVKKALWKISDLALGTYLLSFMFDWIVYNNYLNPNVPTMTDRLPYYLICVPIVFVLSNCASLVLNYVASACIAAYEAIVKLVKKKRAEGKVEFWRDVVFYVLFAGGIGFAIWKAFYGFGGLDESFYLTIPQRFLQGDALFLDEWHLSQMCSVMLIPFVGLFRAFTGSFEGVILAARFFYIFVHAAVTFVIYRRLRKYGYVALFGCLLFFIFTPYDIMACSYDTMGLDLVVLSGVLLGTANYEKKLSLIFAGVFYAGAVLCNPYLAFGYVAYALCVVVHLVMSKKESNSVFKSDMFALRTFIWTTVGVAAYAVVFLIIVFTRISVNDLLVALPKMLDDPEHIQVPFTEELRRYFNGIWTFHPHFKYAVVGYGIMLVTLIFDKKRKVHRSVYLIVSIMLTMFSLALCMSKLTSVYYNAIMFPMIFVSITSYILCDKKPKELFVSLFALGIFYSLCMNFSSNQYFYVISMAITASNLAGFVFLAQLMREMKERDDELDYARMLKYASVVFVTLLICYQSFMQLTAKSNHCFWDGTTDQLTTTIEVGPAKGITTTETNADTYTKKYKDIKKLEKKERGNTLFLTDLTWAYLALDYPSSTYCAAIGTESLVPLDTVLKRLDSYWETNKKKLPKYVYIPKDSKWNIEQAKNKFLGMGYTLSEQGMSFVLEK